jgi:hypothetical protein
MSWEVDYAGEIGSWSAEYLPPAVIDGMRTSHQLGVFFRMDTNPPLHIWMGVSDIPAGFDGIDPDGTVYLGGGRLLNVPSLEVLCNGQSGSVVFGISGIDPATASEVLDTMPDVRGKEVTIGLTTLDDYYQPTTAIIPVWTGKASHPKESSAPVAGDENPVTTLSLAVVTGNDTRSRPSASLWTAAHQTALWRQFFPTAPEQAANPRDRCCDQTSRLARGVAPVWP